MSVNKYKIFTSTNPNHYDFNNAANGTLTIEEVASGYGTATFNTKIFCEKCNGNSQWTNESANMENFACITKEFEWLFAVVLKKNLKDFEKSKHELSGLVSKISDDDLEKYDIFILYKVDNHKGPEDGTGVGGNN